LDFEKPIKDVFNLIRGCDPQPGAFTTMKGKKVRFYDARIGAPMVERPPGEIVSIEKDGIQVAAKGGALKVGKLKLEKGEKVGPVEFAQTVGLKVGNRFGN